MYHDVTAVSRASHEVDSLSIFVGYLPYTTPIHFTNKTTYAVSIPVLIIAKL